MNCSPNFGQFLNRIFDAASFYLYRPRSRVERLRTGADRLKAKLEDVERAINEAERNEQTATAQARQWKSEAEAFKFMEVNAIQQDYEAMRCLGGWSWNCVSINHRVTRKLEAANELISRVDGFSIATTGPPSTAVELPISNNVVGMQPDLIQIVNQIKNENVRVIGIYGMGGIGKTTLLTLINNHEEISKLKFEHVVWIVASKGCKLRKLQMDLAQMVGLNLKDGESERGCASKLFNFLKEKNCLLFLDDIWESYDLVMLGMEQEAAKHGKEQKRKVVVFTTRSEQVCTGMRANVKKKVEGLAFEQAWELFLKYAGEDVVNSEPGINQLAKGITKECAGVPLALITVGRAMSAKRSWEAWDDALTQLKQSLMPEVTGMKERDPSFAAFKLSYESLEDEKMKARLLCCCLWPEDFAIDKVELIECWIGLGLIEEFDSISRAFRRGHSHIETLTFACLLELVDKERTTGIKMHDVIRDMALWMASDCGSNQHRWIVKARSGLNQLELENEQWLFVERASFMHNHLSSLPRQTPTFPKLSMFMLQHNPKLDLIPGPFFQSLPVLTFLDLSGTKITKLPREINMLYELQHLNLNFTPVEALPAELGSLAKLKVLLLVKTERLAKVPKEAISNLPLLKLLDLFESKYADLDVLEGFRGCRKNIGITLHSMIDLERLGSLPKLSTWKLQLQNIDLAYSSQLFESIMSSRNTRQGLERLEIVNVMTGGELIVAWRNKDHEEGLDCLRYMALIAVDDLQKITWKEVEPQTIFPNLHELNIFECKMLRNATWILQLPNLSVLRVSDCDEMEELISCAESSVNSSICLRLLSLAGLPKLNCISQQPLTFLYLERMYVSSCPELRELPFGAEICQKKLKGIFGKKDWWENIKWKDVDDKISISPYFKSNLTRKRFFSPPEDIKSSPVYDFSVNTGSQRKQEIVLHLCMDNTKESDRTRTKARAKVLMTVGRIAGVHSVSLNNNRMIVGGDQIDAVALVAVLRKNFGSVNLLSVINN